MRVRFRIIATTLTLLQILCAVHAQTPAQTSQPASQEPRKANQRTEPTVKAEPFDAVPTEKMAGQCVTLETEAGSIEIEMLAEMAPETVRNFLNLASIGAFDTTTFSRTVPHFVIQGGNLATRENLTQELYQRSTRTVPDEPSIIKHVRGIVSLAKTDQANSGSSHFFILVADANFLDGKFSAFGRVRSGMEIVDQINMAPAENEKPEKPVRILRAVVKPCAKTPTGQD
jgi:peptidyl-prolyl cis-trans isomerase B (cyclophilin B)